ncbi:Fanconi anemia group E protein isoform X2 [Scleropages formosus]|uniref:Fanconi anemia group E protein isoform X2 n=1 Tax=Scleropages formosus TaxID=113540 RepID=UPI0010FAA7C7|nr:Fanconi anemia group E protein isoform X2 [Scleropages formosus]
MLAGAAIRTTMVPERLLRRFDGRSRLLFRALLPGLSGSGDALRLFLRQRRCDPDFSLRSCLEALIQDELCEDGDPGPLKLSPVVCQLPVSLQRGLLSFLHLTAPLHPRSSLLALLKRLDGASCRDPWIRALLAQLRRDLEPDGPRAPELVSPRCESRLRGLRGKFGGADGPSALVAAFDFGVSAEPCRGSPSELSIRSHPQPQEAHGKRKSDAAGLEQDCEEGKGSRSKRRRLDPREDDGDGEQWPSDAQDVALGPSPPTLEGVGSEEPSDPQAAVPEHIKAVVPKIRELLDMQTEWDQDASSVLQVLNECDPSQVELLCQALRLSQLPEQLLPQLCTAVLAPSVELSHSAAAALIRSLFLGRVLSLLDPPSRCLVSVMMSLCGRYPRPACGALLAPVVQAGRLNAVQAELLCRLTRDALEPQHRLLVLGEALTAPWSDELLSVIHALLESRNSPRSSSPSLSPLRASRPPTSARV